MDYRETIFGENLESGLPKYKRSFCEFTLIYTSTLFRNQKLYWKQQSDL